MSDVAKRLQATHTYVGISEDIYIYVSYNFNLVIKNVS
jgi:hypothetical protein